MTVQDATATSTHGVTLTDAAAAKAKALLDQEGRDDLALRIAVQPGGCAGLRYNLFFDDRALDGDLNAEFGGVRLSSWRMCPSISTTSRVPRCSRTRRSPASGQVG